MVLEEGAMSQTGETAGSILRKLLLAREENASKDVVNFLEQELGEQMHRQLGDETTRVTVSIGNRVIPKPEH